MSILTSLGILMLVMLILSFLQLKPGLFLLFSHYANGKYSRKKASDLSLFYILGNETFVVVFLFLCFLLIANLPIPPNFFESNAFMWVISVIIMVLGLAILTLYYRKGAGTKLFISRSLARNLDKNAKQVKSRSDAFALGFVANIPELVLTLPLYLITVLEIAKIIDVALMHGFIIIMIAFATTVPLLIIKLQFQLGYNLANLQKARVKSKLFYQLLISLLYFLLVVVLISFRISL